MTPQQALPLALVPPGPSGFPLFGVYRDIQARPLELLERLRADYGDVVKLSAGYQLYVVAHPDGVKHVLQDNHVNYKKGFDYERMEPLVGHGLLTANGDEWKRHRRIAQPSFHRQRVMGFGALMVRHAHRALERWRALGDGAELDLHAEMMRLTLDIVADALFSVDLAGGSVKADGVAEALGEALHLINVRVNDFVALPMWIPTPFNLALKKNVRVLDALVNDIIRERRKAPASDDLLSMLMDAHDEEGQLSDEELRDEVMTMVLAGHETTANALSFTYLLLTQHPDVRERLEQSLGDAAPTPEDLPKLQYVKQVVEESMRLYPPAWALGRQAIADDVVMGYRIPKGALVMVSQWLTHRDARFWPRPTEFDPSRFEQEAVQQRHRFAAFPFGGGPRLCIGMAFAMMELQLLVATLARAVRFEVLEPQKVELEPLITLRPKGGLRARLRWR